jgi:ribosomal protein S21
MSVVVKNLLVDVALRRFLKQILRDPVARKPCDRVLCSG